MTSLRQLGTDPLAKLVAHFLVAALLVGLVPVPAEASVSRTPLPELPPLSETAAAARRPPDLVVVVVALELPILTETAFGELIAHTGTDPQPYAFTGEPLDPNVGFQYHRARWMDPPTGRFASVDSHKGPETDPSSLHRYVYADNDPASLIDPTGFFGLSMSFAAMSMGTTINAISVPIAGAMLSAAAFDPKQRALILISIFANQFTLAHEVGHALGLRDVYWPTSLMFATTRGQLGSRLSPKEIQTARSTLRARN